MDSAYALAQQLAAKIKAIPNVSNVYIPQSINYPGLQLNIDRERASLIGLSAKDVVDNVITALTSDGMVAPSYWIDPQERQQLHGDGAVREPLDRQHVDGGFEEHSSARRAPSGYAPMQEGGQADSRLARSSSAATTSPGMCPLGAVADIQQINTPTEVDHYQIRRVIDIYVATKTEALQGVERASTTCWPRPSTTGTR